MWKIWSAKLLSRWAATVGDKFCTPFSKMSRKHSPDGLSILCFKKKKKITQEILSQTLLDLVSVRRLMKPNCDGLETKMTRHPNSVWKLSLICIFLPVNLCLRPVASSRSPARRCSKPSEGVFEVRFCLSLMQEGARVLVLSRNIWIFRWDIYLGFFFFNKYFPPFLFLWVTFFLTLFWVLFWSGWVQSQTVFVVLLLWTSSIVKYASCPPPASESSGREEKNKKQKKSRNRDCGWTRSPSRFCFPNVEEKRRHVCFQVEVKLPDLHRQTPPPRTVRAFQDISSIGWRKRCVL